MGSDPCFVSAAMIGRNVAAEVVSQVDLARTHDLLLGIEQHLFPLGDPAGGARNGEKNGNIVTGKPIA